MPSNIDVFWRSLSDSGYLELLADFIHARIKTKSTVHFYLFLMYIYLGESTCVITDHWFRFQAPFNDDLAGKEILDNWHRSIIWISLIVKHLPFWQTWYYTVSKTRNQAPLIYRVYDHPHPLTNIHVCSFSSVQRISMQ